MKVSDLHGPLLDYWVAKAEGYSIESRNGEMWVYSKDEGGDFLGYIGGEHIPQYSPSTIWDDGGPIIERELIEVTGIEKWRWHAVPHIPPIPTADGWHEHLRAEGTTPLIAAMRGFLLAKYGEEVPHDEVRS